MYATRPSSEIARALATPSGTAFSTRIWTVNEITSLGLPRQDVKELQNTAWTFQSPARLPLKDIARGNAPVCVVVVELNVGSVTTKSTLTMEESVDEAVAVIRVLSATPDVEQGLRVRV